MSYVKSWNAQWKNFCEEEIIEFQRDFEDDVIEEGNKNGWYVDYEQEE